MLGDEKTSVESHGVVDGVTDNAVGKKERKRGTIPILTPCCLEVKIFFVFAVVRKGVGRKATSIADFILKLVPI